MDVRILDTSLRDGSQSLWASGIRYGMMQEVADDLDQVGFEYIEVPANPIFFKKMVRDLKENPWDTMRMLASKFTRTPTACMGGIVRNLNTFGVPTPPVLGELFTRRMAEIGVLNRAQVMCNTLDQIDRELPGDVPRLHEMGYDVAIAISYTISPRHTDEYYAEKTRLAAAFKPERLYLKDQGGLLTPDRLRTLLPIIVREAGDVPVEIHSHCTTGLAPIVYLEALKLGVSTLHCGIPPLANGSAQPSVLEIVKNARLEGHNVSVDDERLRAVSERLYTFADIEGMPIGRPSAYDADQYNHQIPGGVISNLRFQLEGLGLQDRLDEVLQECIEIRRELGYPIMITPYSQYVATQAAVHVATGARYETVIDPIIRIAQGAFGEDSGYTWMDPNLKDRILSLPRAAELAELHERSTSEMTLKEARVAYGGLHLSDEELLLRAILQNEHDVEQMHAAGPPKRYATSSSPLADLIRRLESSSSVRYIQVRSGDDTLVLQRSASGANAIDR
ncbi:carboxylase [Pseudoclavibacter endophyticus]|uniref:hypothetical protein n=1 Tax=Pseudoclavibacter endophyticus TaxID=1778590 RepID=UPI00166A8FAA|nr:hypothetical protein [Pseudoclavibacter endophyticus]GGA60946.1 carboxylase [Pseudoclavibacter endophyticus]